MPNLKTKFSFVIAPAFHYICLKMSYASENHLEAEISFSGHLCEELCSSGPILRIDEKVYKEVNLSGLYKILQEEFPIK